MKKSNTKEYNSITVLMKYRIAKNQSMEVEVKIEVTLGTTGWEKHKEMFQILDLGAGYIGVHICENVLN